jgi:hypothetical protein
MEGLPPRSPFFFARTIRLAARTGNLPSRIQYRPATECRSA